MGKAIKADEIGESLRNVRVLQHNEAYASAIAPQYLHQPDYTDLGARWIPTAGKSLARDLSKRRYHLT